MGDVTMEEGAPARRSDQEAAAGEHDRGLEANAESAAARGLTSTSPRAAEVGEVASPSPAGANTVHGMVSPGVELLRLDSRGKEKIHRNPGEEAHDGDDERTTGSARDLRSSAESLSAASGGEEKRVGANSDLSASDSDTDSASIEQQNNGEERSGDESARETRASAASNGLARVRGASGDAQDRSPRARRASDEAPGRDLRPDARPDSSASHPRRTSDDTSGEDLMFTSSDASAGHGSDSEQRARGGSENAATSSEEHTTSMDDSRMSISIVTGPRGCAELEVHGVFETRPLALQESQFLDRYGFICSAAERTETDAAYDAARREKNKRRIHKWLHMLGDSVAAFEQFRSSHHRVLKRRVRKGIPDTLRRVAWLRMSGAEALMQSRSGEYERLLALQDKSGFEGQIMRDINRTFPQHALFLRADGQRSLYRVLAAYALFDREVGYVQGMGFLAALILTYMPEEEAFWMLVRLVRHYRLGGLFLPGLPLLKQYLFQFEKLLEHLAPKLNEHMSENMVFPSAYATQWFTTLFSYTGKFSVVLRIWDCYLLEGEKILFRASLGVILRSAHDFLRMDFEKILSQLRRIPVEPCDPDTFMRGIFGLPLTRKQIAALEAEYWQQESSAAAEDRDAVVAWERVRRESLAAGESPRKGWLSHRRSSLAGHRRTPSSQLHGTSGSG